MPDPAIIRAYNECIVQAIAGGASSRTEDPDRLYMCGCE